MHIQSRPHLIAAMLLASLVPNVTCAWGTFIVDPNCAGAYSTIQDAIDAAAAYTDDSHADYVWISQNASNNGYTHQHIVINDPETVIIEGGFTDCNDFDPGTDHTTISGAGNDGGPVFQITGNGGAVVFSNLYITGADRSGQNGGGIYYAGHGLLQTELTSIFLNHAAYGAGIYFSGSGGDATLYVEHDTTVLNNTADVSGGGIRIEGTTRLYALKAQTWIGYNHANGGYGGGLEILGPARADIGSPGYNSVGVISYNDAVNGGGAAVIQSSGDAALRIFTTDPANPVQIDDNVASGNGGGVYVSANTYQAGNEFCAFDFRLHDNQAADGAAIYGDDSSRLLLNDNAACGPESPPALGAVDCSAACNEVRGNHAADANGTPTAGSVIAGRLEEGHAFSLRDNVAATLVHAPVAWLSDCLIADNHTQHELINFGSPGYAGIVGCTMTHNVIDNGYVVYASSNNGFLLSDSIIGQPGYSVLDYVGNTSNRTIDYVIANELASLTGAQHSWSGALVYVDAANGDYHLAANSMGVDYAPASGGADLDGNPRDVDLPSRGNLYGSRDIGAYERQTGTCGTADTIFCNAFEP